MAEAEGVVAAGALRDKGALTRLMILRVVARGEAATLRQIGEEVGVTVQAVSEHLKRMTSDGWVESGDRGPRVTPEGTEALRAHLLALKEYVDSAVRDLNQIETTAARAADSIRAGDPVGLFMENGELVAYPGKESPSRGVAAQDADAAMDVAVVDLEGIISLETGTVTFGIVPDSPDGGSRKADAHAVADACAAAGLVVAEGPVAAYLAHAAGVSPVRFGGAHAAVDAALRGLQVLVLVERARADETKRRFEGAQAEWDVTIETTTRRLDA